MCEKQLHDSISPAIQNNQGLGKCLQSKNSAWAHNTCLALDNSRYHGKLIE